jgi:sugar phosphate isomerase/epimerase
MDSRKANGQTATDLTHWFSELPEAGLCLDLAHVSSIDADLSVGHELLDEHGHRLRHVHLSSLDDDCHHRSLTSEDEQRFGPLLDRCRDVPWILEAPAR